MGQTIGIGQCPGRPTTIVGVVADHLDRQRVDVVPMVYLPYPQGGAFNPTTIALRVRGEPAALVPDVRRVIAGLESSLTDGDVTTGLEYRDAHLRRERTLTSLLSAFGGIAVLMSCLGIYATVTHVAARRTRELGIRTALGAGWSKILNALLGRLSAAIMLGVVLGLAAAMMLSTYVESLLFGVSRFDSWTVAAAAMIIAVAGGLAALRPALRAIRLNPVDALRAE
jgi:predicted lysophospholipase L1 biosynthesis ABC-type transport system permease subunit